ITVSNGRLNVNKLLQKVKVSNVPVLNAFSLRTPNAGSTLTSFPMGTTQYNITWDTSATGATYRFVFGNPTTTPRKISLTSGINSLTLSSGQLDNILAGIGVNPGDSIVGQWDIWTYRVLPVNDSLKSNNGPRSLTFRRGIPVLSAFNLLSPPNGTTITTSTFNTSSVNISWSRSGQGVSYKWKFGSPALTNVRLSLSSNNSGFDSLLTISNSSLDALLSGIGLNAGDSLVGQWSVWAYNGSDSVKAAQTFAMTLKRQSKGDVIVVYDSTITACRSSRDSVVNNLSTFGITFDLYNRKGNTGTASISYRGYKKVILLGEGTSVMSNVVKDSVKSYLASGGNTISTKSKLIIIAEDIGYHLDRTASTFYDSSFARSSLGFDFISDRPGSSGNRGIVGVSINSGIADSTVGPWPDVLRKTASVPTSQLYNLYKFRLFPDSMNAVGRLTTTYNVAVIGVDLESMRSTTGSSAGSPAKRIVDGGIKFVDEISTSISNSGLSIPVEFSLSQNYPNPFNPTTKINYEVPFANQVILKVYDLLGKEVMTLVNDKQPAGRYEVQFDGTALSSGAYFYRLEAGDFKSIKRMILIK
ncbi:MAG: T9SS type A sorting domain-containing protein, partial [Ignavibacteria bacterium]